MIWLQIAYLVVSTLITIALTPKPPTVNKKPAGMGDFDIPTAEPSRPIPIVFGTVLMKSPNVVWWGHLKSEPIKSEGGGKK